MSTTALLRTLQNFGSAPRSWLCAEAWTLQELSDKVRGHNETHKELLDEFNKTRAMLEDVMGYYENCEHANATTKTNFESRSAPRLNRE